MLNDCMDGIFELSEKKQEIIKIVTDTEISKEEALTKAFKDFITMHISSRKNALIICVNQTKNLFLSNTTEKLVIADWRDIINVSSTTWKELTEKYKEETNSFINNVSRSFY